MSDPTKKSPAVEAFLEAFAKKMGSPLGRIASIRNDVCVTCGGRATEFTTSLAKTEYKIHGLCQECQDKSP